MVGWIIQAGIWSDCEIEGPIVIEYVNSYCPQSPLDNQGARLARGLVGGKIAIAWIVVAVEGLCVGHCIYGIVRKRREAKQGQPLKTENGSEMELQRRSEA